MNLDKKNMIKILGIVTFAIVLFSCVMNVSQVGVAVEAVTAFLMPFAVGVAIAFFINVPMRFIETKIFKKWTKLPKLKRAISLVLGILFLIILIGVVLLVIIPQMITTISEIDFEGYINKIIAFVEKTLVDYPWIIEEFNNFLVDFDQEIQKFIQSALTWLSTGLTSVIDVAGNMIGGIVSGFIGFFFAIYLLVDKENLSRQAKMAIYSVTSEEKADKIIKIARLSDKSFSNFISGQCLEAIILGILFAIAMKIFGMPYVSLISVLIGFTALIPVVGGFIGCLIGAFLILMQDPMQAVWFIVMFIVIQQLEGNLIYPRVVGNSVGLPPIWVLALVTIGGNLMGIFGIIIMIPIGSVVYALFREFVYKKIGTKSDRVKKIAEKPPEPAVKTKKFSRKGKSKKQ